MHKKTAAKKPFIRRHDLWSSNATYSNHRIPGMLVTTHGTLLVYCEARREASDWAMMDILLRRSVNFGVSFSDNIVLAAGTEQHPTVNNPVMMQDQNGRIHFLYCEDYTINGGRILRRYSDDDGISWSEPLDITAYAMPEYHNAFALGPGHGILLRDGTLLVPIWMVPKRFNAPLFEHSPSEISTFYSRDNGETWKIGELLGSTSDVFSPNETVAVLTSDGSVHLNIRHQANHRAKAYSPNGFSAWTQYGPDHSLSDPQCFGSIAAYKDQVNPYSLIFANCAHTTSRKNVTARISMDDGKSYPYEQVIDAERGGYVEVATDNRHELIYVLYENQGGITNHLAVFNYDYITENEVIAVDN